MYFTPSDIDRRRERLSSRWNDILSSDEAVLITSGDPLQKPGGLDQTYPFLPHPAYFWLTGRRRESEAVLYSREGSWIEFQKEVGSDEAVWEGPRTDLLVEREGKPLSELDTFLQKQSFSKLYRLGADFTDEGKSFDLRTALDQTRRVKDDAEVALVKQLAGIAGDGYRAIEQVLRPGISELDVQIAYESEILRKGAHGVPYDSIVGSGTNAAILHALPTRKSIEKGELVLVDAGAAIYDYCVDITRVFPSSDDLSQRQKALYNLVLCAHNECIAMSKPGVFWRDVHLHAAKVITEGLLQLGVLKGSMDTLLEREISAVFFPHGLGHLVGLRVRDTGHEENRQPKLYAGARLRVDIQLEAGHLITVEPGCYFISALLNSEAVRNGLKDYINWQELEHWKGLGGVRIEDNILITDSGNDNLTQMVPKASL